MIPGLKIADLRGPAGSVGVFGRTGGRNSADRLVVGLDDDVIVINFPQNPREAGRVVGRVARPALGVRILLRIPTAAGITPTRVSAAGVTHAWTDDLADAGKSCQQENS